MDNSLELWERSSDREMHGLIEKLQCLCALRLLRGEYLSTLRTVGTKNQLFPHDAIPVIIACRARVAELVDALDLGSCGVTRESSSLSFRTILL
jgi:hypothetical protein